jgi:hypothetical protein
MFLRAYLRVCLRACVRVPRRLGVCMRMRAPSRAHLERNTYDVTYFDVISGPSVYTEFFYIMS